MSGFRDERGAILIQVTVAMVGLLSFSALVMDYGVMWVSRRQAQNTADAAALAGAISMMQYPGDYDRARASAKAVGETNKVFGVAPTINLGSGDSVDETEDISFPLCPPGVGAGLKSCIRVNVYRNEEGHDGVAADPLPTFFAHIFGRTEQGVKATATAQIGSGNQVTCLLPFAVIDRWQDDFDDNKDDTYFPNDDKSGILGWSQNDDYQPFGFTPKNPGVGCAALPCDTYIPPYNDNPATTGFTVANAYGTQLIMKGGLGQYSSGWAQQVDLPLSGGSNDYRTNIEQCNKQPVGIAQSTLDCDKNTFETTGHTEADGCISIKTGTAQGPTSQGINMVVGYDSAAHWDPSAPGPEGQTGAVVGGDGMSSPRIRPLVILDIDAYVANGCDGTTCVGKVANIIGFFVEGMCKDVTLDPGYVCPDPNKDVVGRIVKIPALDVSGVGTVQDPSAFLEVVRLVR
jgi:hypothetical protein